MIWLVGFMAAAPEATRWWQRLLRPGFAHVWCCREIGDGLWLWQEWTPTRILAGTVTREVVDRAAAAAALVLAYVPHPITGEPRPTLPLPSLHHCATHTAHVLGVRLPAPWTPWALARALKKRGACPLPPPAQPEAAA